MTKTDYEKLVSEIRKYDRLYYVENKPVISDYEYDLLLKKLEKMEADHPEWITETSPTQRVKDPLSKGFQQAAHAVPMLSLDNTYNEEELEDFIKRVHKLLEKSHVPLCAELKMDGIAVSVRYEKGVYTRALTRGDGKKGDDITSNMRTIHSVPLELTGSHIPDVLEVRGEVFMSHKAFQAQNKRKEEAGEELWANPRNAAAGSLKLLDPSEVSKRGLAAVFYGLAESDHPLVQSQFDVHDYLKKLGLPVFDTDHMTVAETTADIMKFAHKIEKTRDSLPFDIDGIVIKVDHIKYWSLLGTTGKSPRWAVAYKFAPEQATTQIREITVQVGRTGVLTPVAELEPVFLAGSTIARATLHNEEEVARKDIREGDWAVIAKGGDVIPQVLEVDLKRRSSHSKAWKMPTHCPVCGTHVVRTEGEVAVRCPNSKGCEEQVIRRIAYFASKDAMDIDHMGEKVVEQLVRKKLVKHVSDVYKLTAEDLAQLEGFKEKSIHNLLTSIDKSRHVSLARFILALSIRYVGEETAEILSREAGSIHKLGEMSEEDLLKIDGVGDKMAVAIVAYFQESSNLKEIELLLENGVKPQASNKVIRTDHTFSGKTFVLTGALQNFTRDQAEDLIKERGGKVTGSVSKKTDFVLVGEDAGSKLDKAKELQIQILSEKQFEGML
ncbi:MAG TPA: NAD-dependent DNA ligase LigA [Rhabdochlamydiaceae bacterium]